MISKSTKKMIVKVGKNNSVVIYSNLKLFCEIERLSYHTYKNKKFPFFFETKNENIEEKPDLWQVQKLTMWYNKKH